MNSISASPRPLVPAPRPRQALPRLGKADAKAVATRAVPPASFDPDKPARSNLIKAGPLDAGTLTPADPRLGAPVNVSYGSNDRKELEEAVNMAAFSMAAGIAGQALIPVPGLGAAVGGLVGVGIGWLWNRSRR